MKPRTKEDWTMVFDAVEWFMALIRNHEPAQIAAAMRAADESLGKLQCELPKCAEPQWCGEERKCLASLWRQQPIQADKL